MKANKGFNLLSVIIIICAVSLISALATGIIVTNSYKTSNGLNYNELLNDEHLSEFLEVYASVSDNYYEDVDKDALIDTALNAMLDYLGDSYTTHLNSSETKALEERLAGSYKGIGIEIIGSEIVGVTKDSPAAEAGLQVGDLLVSVDGTSVGDKSSSEISDLIKNSSNESVSLIINRAGTELTYDVAIADVATKAIAYSLLENNIGYLKMDIFSKTLSSQVDLALKDMESQGMQKLIMDLRDNTGGYLESAEDTASLFLEKGKLIYSLENSETKADYHDETSACKNYPIVILLNSNSASASEILAAALKDSYSGPILFVGETSYGKGLVQQTYDLSDGSMAKYTSARWLRPNGECINGKGLKPDYEVIKAEMYDEAGNPIDNQLQRAIEVISALYALFFDISKNLLYNSLKREEFNENRR